MTERELHTEIALLHAQVAGLKAYIECIEDENRSLRKKLLDKLVQPSDSVSTRSATA